MNSIDRRAFVRLSSHTALGTMLASGLSAEPDTTALDYDLTIQEVIDQIMAQIPGDTDGATVDTIKTGNPNQKVTGIVTTFMATIDVIEKAKWLGANLIITHEPTFYNHFDETDWLKHDQVYQYKRELLAEHNIVVWRFHDFWHQYRPDGILTGFLQKLNWENYYDDTAENTCEIPKISLRDLAVHIKQQFQLTRTFIVGNPDMTSHRVGILPGAWGGRAHISLLETDIDTIIVGESSEWEGIEYIRDASLAGFKKGMIVMGHARSEEPGMAYLKDWLSSMFPAVKISHIHAGDPLIPV